MAETLTKQDIGASDGMRIVTEAASWSGVAYSLVGASSSKTKGADCSGSTYWIYSNVGFKYTYSSSSQFPSYALESGLFRELSPKETKQDGDILSWPDHMAIYATFKGDPTHAITIRPTRDGKHTWKQVNDMWTATHPGGAPYAPGKMGFFKPNQKPRVFRYQK